jgi:hypothetical protein
MDRIRSWPVFLGMWATQATAIAAVEAIYIQGPLFAPVVGAGAVLSAIGLFFGWRRAAGRFESPALISFLVGIPAALWVLLMLVTARLPWMLLYLLVATQFARNPWVRERRDFYVGCGITVVWIIFAAGHVLAGWPIAKFFVLYVAAMLFALIASHVDERFFTAEGGRSDEVLRRGVVPLTALVMSVAVVSIGALIYLFAVHPASLRLGMVDAPGGVTPRLGDEGIALPPGGSSSGIDTTAIEAWVSQGLRVLFGEGIAQALAGAVGGAYQLSVRVIEVSRQAMLSIPLWWLAIFLAAGALVCLLRRLGVLDYAATWAAYVWLRLRARSSAPGRTVFEGYRGVERALARKGYSRAAHLTHREYFRDLDAQPWFFLLAAGGAFEIFGRLRYSSQTPAKADADEVLALLARVIDSWWDIPRPVAARTNDE